MSTATVRLLHGTTSRAVTLMRDRGHLEARCPLEVAAGIEQRYCLPVGSVRDSTAFEFSRSRAADDRIYLTQCERTAIAYARIGSEILDDALHAAWIALNRDRLERLNCLASRHPDRERWHQNETTFKTGHLRAMQLHPVVLELDVPHTALIDDVIAQSIRRHGNGISTVADWLDVVSDRGQIPVSCLTVRAPVPADWVVAERSVQNGAAATAADRVSS